ncbi:hypothetical protein [Shimia ponticola]|uniref:hypothetical protein n=1 Tax=Shimia ponticola TaxID=2582893 RepID=UPI0011BEDE18|nr:hypothetical protein [Shimia ponticola]
MASWMTRLLGLAAIVALSACATSDLEETPEPIGDFKLGFFVPSTAAEMTKGPASRDATPEEWKAAMKAAFEPRFKRYTGDSFFHIGAIVDGYVLAQPGIPLVLAPKSVLIFRVTIIEDATGTQYPEEAHQITVVESVGAGTLLGSGLTSSKEEQLADLAENAARQTERWMREQPWFGEFSGSVDASPEDDAADLEAPVEGEPLSAITLPEADETQTASAAADAGETTAGNTDETAGQTTGDAESEADISGGAEDDTNAAAQETEDA